MRALITGLAACTALGGSTALPAAPTLATPFADHAVLQRDRPVAVWGDAAPGAAVSIGIDAMHVTAKAGADGRWRAMLPAHAAGGPYTLTVEAADGSRRQVNDILFGDVFLCSGQSNMEIAVRQSLAADGNIAASADDSLRLLHVDHQYGPAPFPALKIQAPWAAAAPAIVPDFSGACYYMGRELRKTQQVPIGLIEANWGGSTIESWMSADALRRFGGFDPQLAIVAQKDHDPHGAMLAWSKGWEDWWRTTTRGSQGEPWRDPVATQPWTPVPAFTLWQKWNRGLESYNASMWYRTSVVLTAAQAAQGATLLLGPIEEIDHTWLNGRPIGMTEERGATRSYQLATGALQAGENDIVLNIFDGWIGGGIHGPAEGRALLLADGTRIALDRPWYYLQPPGNAAWAPRAPWSALSGYATIGNGMISPLAPYTIRGVAWYQGESNTYEAERYDKLLAAWMADWRQRFAQPDLPFFIVQLTSFGAPAADTPTDEGWGRLRDAQRRAAAADRHAAIVVTHDFGDRTDVHPADKQQVGLRLARAAQAIAYGAGVTPSGPLPVRAQLTGGSVRVDFRDVDGLVTYSAHTAIGFELCDAAQTCRFADGRIDGPAAVALALDGGPPPATVRFCWANAPMCNLFGKDGMPVTTFELPVAR